MLEEAREAGALGPGPVGAHLDHAEGLAAMAGAPPARFLDLGSGAGVPGLVLASRWPSSSAVLLEAMAKRCRLLELAVATLGLSNCQIVEGRAEEVGRDPSRREAYDLVVSRSFGPPAVTAECAAPFLRVGGRLLVAEPPEPDRARWPDEGLAELGLGPAVSDRRGDVAAALIPKVAPTADRWPRRTGIPSKRPLW